MSAELVKLLKELQKLPLSGLHDLVLEALQQQRSDLRPRGPDDAPDSANPESGNHRRTARAVDDDAGFDLVDRLSALRRSLSATPSEAPYERLTQQFREYERRLFEHSLLVDRLLTRGDSGNRDRIGLAIPLQQTLFIQCPAGGRSAGRFRVVNRSDRSATARPAARVAEEAVVNGSFAPMTLSFDPVSRRLEPGEDALFQVTVELPEEPSAEGTSVEASVDVLLDERPAVRLWLDVEVDHGRTG